MRDESEMNLTKRLLLANAATVIIPLIMTAFIALAVIFIQGKMNTSEFSLENYQRLSEIRFALAGDQTGVLNRTPEIIEDPGFQTHLRQQISDIGGEVILLIDDRILSSSRPFTRIDIEKCLETGRQTENKNLLVFDNVSYTVELLEFRLNKDGMGKIIMLAPVDWSGNDLEKYLILFVLIFVSFFILTNFLVSRRYSKNITLPLRNLQKAAAEIRKGNLDYQIAEEGDREIQALCRDLELMRIKLKESVYTRLKYEDNRKMLISSISHDLKTPVTSIKGYIEGILDGVANTPEKTRKYLNTVQLKAEQVNQMIDDLLLYAKLDLNQLPYDFEKNDIAEYLHKFLAECEPELEQRGVIMNFENLLPSPRLVQLDKDRMRRVLTNIIDNALKYMNRNPGELKITLRETISVINIEIRDNGFGIREQDIPYIFDRFFRSDASRGEIKGSGLGLAIAKQIIEGHQGKIWAVGHGTEGTSIIISLRKT